MRMEPLNFQVVALSEIDKFVASHAVIRRQRSGRELLRNADKCCKICEVWKRP